MSNMPGLSTPYRRVVSIEDQFGVGQPVSSRPIHLKIRSRSIHMERMPDLASVTPAGDNLSKELLLPARLGFSVTTS